MRQVYCSNCGTRLQVIRKALPKYGAIVDLVNTHECPPEPVPLDLKPVAVTIFQPKAEGKFAEGLEAIQPTKPPLLDGVLRDRRDEREATSTAPQGVLDQLKDL